jgi:hypothetical protein
MARCLLEIVQASWFAVSEVLSTAKEIFGSFRKPRGSQFCACAEAARHPRRSTSARAAGRPMMLRFVDCSDMGAMC